MIDPQTLGLVEWSMGSPTSKTEKGTRYFELTSSGFKQEDGGPMPEWFATIREAESAYIKIFEDVSAKYLEASRPVWRMAPELVTRKGNAHKRYAIYSRLCFE